MQNGYPSTLQAQKNEMVNKLNIFNKIDWWWRRESNPTSALKTLNLPILRMPALQRYRDFQICCTATVQSAPGIPITPTEGAGNGQAALDKLKGGVKPNLAAIA